MIGKQCKDIMTNDPFSCVPADTVQRVAQVMKERNVGAVPICESHETRRLVGIVTDRDLTIRVIAEGLDPKSTVVGDVMTRQVYTCRLEDDVEKSIELMERLRVRRVPVVDEQDRLVGMITQGDIAIRLRDPQTVAEVIMEVSKPDLAA